MLLTEDLPDLGLSVRCKQVEKGVWKYSQTTDLDTRPIETVITVSAA